MERETEEADLVLVMGTSLGGLYADQVATECAKRALGVKDWQGRDRPLSSLGSVIINLQQAGGALGTNAVLASARAHLSLISHAVPLSHAAVQTTEDDKMTLKFSGKSDDVLVKLLTALGLEGSLPRDPKCNAKFAATQCALVPYDAKTGLRLPAGMPRMWLDLRAGAKVRLITDGEAKHNCQGAKQPNTIHIGSKPGQKFNGKPIPNAGNAPGNGVVGSREEDTCSLLVKIEDTVCRLGLWWPEEAASGGLKMLPLVNQNPAFEGSPMPPEPADGAAPSRKAPSGRKGGDKSKQPTAAAKERKVPDATKDKAVANVSSLKSEYAALGS